MNSRKIISIVVGVVLAIFGITVIISLGELLENNSASEILVVQAPFSGKLTVYTTAGRKWQGWGTCTHYRKSTQFWFSEAKDQGGDSDQSIRIRFNDGGHAQVSGAARFDLPLDTQSVLDIHQTFGSQNAVYHDLIRPVMEKSVYLTGPLLSSQESYSEKRSDMINFIEDQATHGIYQTEPAYKEIDDIITGQKKWVTTVDLKKSKDGVVLRQEASPLERFHIHLYNITLNDIAYENIVNEQIATQQKAKMAVQIAMTNTKKAEQDVLTYAKQGEAAATKSKWDQEVEKATEVTRAQKDKAVAETKAAQDKSVAETNAQQRLAVAELDRQAAEQKKQEQILLGEGESKRRQLVMAADGALSVKLATYERVQNAYAGALAGYRGNLVPTIIMGGSSGGQPGSVADLMSLIQAKTARDLQLDLGLPKATAQP